MQDLSFWAQLSIVVAAAVLGPVVALLLALIAAMLLRWVGPADAPPPVFVGINLAGKLLRKRFGPGGSTGWSAGAQPRNEGARSAHVNPARPAAN